jgi:hypothetical protein
MIRNMIWRRAWVSLRLFAVILLAVIIVAPEWPAFGDARFRLRAIVGQERQFDFLVWTLDALGVKAEALLADIQSFLPYEAESEFVLGYLQQVRAAQILEAEIERTYADPMVADPARAAAARQAEVDAIRRELVIRQPVAEAIVQRQVATFLRDEGLAIGGVTFPPVLMTMSPVPYMLIVSPRDRIEQADYAALVPGLATDVKEEMESAVFNELDMSALVVPIGGLGIYPAMIRETSNINWLAEVTAHEWAHHWLSLRPLGVRYLDSPALRTINETVASLVDLEIGPQVIERFYPEMVPPKPLGPPLPSRPVAPAEPPTFDFAAEMADTRIEVDRLLAEGLIEEAEAYMEERRQLFVNHGYAIRKLNQAYFAFYGGYAAEPGGAAGADPIGPMLRRIRTESPSLRVFLDSVSRITSFEDLLILYQEVVGEDPAALLE